MTFAKTIREDSNIKASFMVVKKINELFSKLNREKKSKGASFIKSYKRCIFNAED